MANRCIPYLATGRWMSYGSSLGLEDSDMAAMVPEA